MKTVTRRLLAPTLPASTRNQTRFQTSSEEAVESGQAGPSYQLLQWSMATPERTVQKRLTRKGQEGGESTDLTYEIMTKMYSFWTNLFMAGWKYQKLIKITVFQDALQCSIVTIYQAMWSHIPEDSVLRSHCNENLKSHTKIHVIIIKHHTIICFKISNCNSSSNCEVFQTLHISVLMLTHKCKWRCWGNTRRMHLK
jgi:hypothetical protein